MINDWMAKRTGRYVPYKLPGKYCCYLCRKLKDPEEFYKDSARWNGCGSRCKKCDDYRNAWRRDNPGQQFSEKITSLAKSGMTANTVSRIADRKPRIARRLLKNRSEEILATAMTKGRSKQEYSMPLKFYRRHRHQPNSFGKYLRALRMSRNLTQKGLSQKFGWDVFLGKPILQSIESMSRIPTPEVLQKYSAIFEIPVAELEAYLVAGTVEMSLIDEMFLLRIPPRGRTDGHSHSYKCFRKRDVRCWRVN